MPDDGKLSAVLNTMYCLRAEGKDEFLFNNSNYQTETIPFNFLTSLLHEAPGFATRLTLYTFALHVRTLQ